MEENDWDTLLENDQVYMNYGMNQACISVFQICYSA